LLLAHLVAALVASYYWRRLAVWLATIVQVLASLWAAFLSSMAVQGKWL
jgi:hypothetical protein